MWSTIILCNFQSCCCCYFCFGRCIVWGKISNYWFITFWMKNIFTWNQVDPALWNGVFPEFFSDKNKTEPKWLVITFWMKNIFYVKSGWSCSMKWGFPRFFFLKKQNWTKMVGYNGLGWNKILMELGWIYTRISFSEKESKTKTIGNSTPCTELRCWNAM